MSDHDWVGLLEAERRERDALLAEVERLRERDAEIVRFLRHRIASYEAAEYASATDRHTYLAVVNDLTSLVLSALTPQVGAQDAVNAEPTPLADDVELAFIREGVDSDHPISEWDLDRARDATHNAD